MTRPSSKKPSTAGEPDGAGDLTASDRASLEALGLGDLPGLSLPDPNRDYETPTAVVGPVTYFDASHADRPDKAGKVLDSKGRPVDKTEWPRIILMKMGRRGHRAGGVMAPTEKGLVQLHFEPFAISDKLPPEFVDSVTKVKGKGGRYSYMVPWFWKAPPEHMIHRKTLEKISDERGNCHNRWFIKDADGNEVQTCPYANCPHHPMPAGISHSIWMAQKFVTMLQTDTVIQRYIAEFDGRALVSQVASRVIEARSQRMMRELGMTHGQNPNINF